MKNFKLHAIVLGLIVIAEMIGVHSFKVGVGTIVLLPMLFALLLGVLTTPKFLKISGKAEMLDASSLLGLTLMLLMARYGTLVGPTLPKIIAASPALILQEFGNLGTIFFGLMASVAASTLPFHPYALAMAAGVGSASMMTAAVGSLCAMFPEMAEQLAALLLLKLFCNTWDKSKKYNGFYKWSRFFLYFSLNLFSH